MRNTTLGILLAFMSVLYVLAITDYAQEMEEMAENRESELQRVKDLTDHLVKERR